MQEKRVAQRLTQYWELVRKANVFPEFAHFNAEPVRDIWPQCFTVHIDAKDDKMYKCEYMGAEVAKAYGRDLTGLSVDYRIQQFPGAVIFKKLGQVVKEQKILIDNGHFTNADGKMIKYRACFLPFGSEKKGVTHIIVGLSFRLF